MTRQRRAWRKWQRWTTGGSAERMVDAQIASRGVRDPRVLDAMREVPRHLFVDAGSQAQAYDDRPLPIGEGQTISQPYIVAVMTRALERPTRPSRARDRHRLRLPDRHPRAAGAPTSSPSSATRRSPTPRATCSASSGYRNVAVVVGDGTAGLSEPGAVRPHPRHGRRAGGARGAARQLAPTAAGW